MNSTDYENRILDAIETITNNAITKAGYDRTIQATIVESIDSVLGKYIVKYQDSEFEVYSNNINIYYPPGTLVNVLVPNGDFNLDKIITSAKDKSQIEYSNYIEEEDRYKNVSGNVISSTQEFGLCSYKTNDICVLYNKNTGEKNINIDIEYIEKNITGKDSILCGAEFRTDLDKVQQKSGNYGLVFEIEFLNTSTQEIITNSFVLDIDQMKGNPYILSSFVRQYKIFKINIDNFIGIKKIYLFSKGFPGQEDEKPNDIFAQNFELCLLNQIDTDLTNDYEIEIDSDKKYFDDYDAEITQMHLMANLKYKNQFISDESINFYWFKENTAISNTSLGYTIEGGPGWECLNPYNETEEQRLYVSSDNLIISKQDVLSVEMPIKCVAVKKDKVIANQMYTVSNYAAEYTIKIESLDGDIFYFDNGHPTLKCLINGEEGDSSYSYNWGYIDSDNIYHQLEETPIENEIYNAAMAAYTELITRIETGLAMAAASQAELDELLAIIEQHNQRVEGNTLHNIDLTKIVDKAIFKCAVIKNNVALGTASFTISNLKEVEGEYHINILNGIQTFHYTTDGISPTNTSLNNPLVLQPLKAILYDNNGKIINGDALNDCEFYWNVPKENTLIIAKDGYGQVLEYQLAENYDENKLYNNNIELTVMYKGLVLKQSTVFTFTKDGEPGTNGTDIICRIVPYQPNDENYKYNCYPMIVNTYFNFGCRNYEKTENYDYYQRDKWFVVELWKDGQVFLTASDSNLDQIDIDDDKKIDIKWSILRNVYGNEKTDPTAITISKDVNGYHFSNAGYKSNAANIVKAEVTYQGVVYYATIPVITVKTKQDENYSIFLERNTGFRFVQYAENGRHPIYSSSTPFRIKVFKEIDGLTEDISTINNEYSLTYKWNKQGKMYNYDGTFRDSYDFDLVEDASLEKNEKFLAPKETYTGENVTNGLEVEIYNMQEENIGQIHIPLYFYLDRYAHAEINGWDGNSISLSDDGGLILAPQIGAGHKEVDNTFTGLIMGTETTTEGIKKTGLIGKYHNQQTIFLDANTGKAEFGHLGSGQIIIDPTGGSGIGDIQALIYGGNYKKRNIPEGVIGSGLLINLTKPEICFGNENFIVDQDGKLTAVEAKIKGKIEGLSGTFGSGANKIKIGEDTNVDYSYIYSGEKVNIDAKSSGFYIGTNGIALGSPGENDNESPFKVGADGILHAKKAVIQGEINATSGAIGNWKIQDGSIKYANQSDFYLDSSGEVKFGNFTVDSGGNVALNNANISGGSISLEGGNVECQNGLIVGSFKFGDSSTFDNPRNCVGKDSIIARGEGVSGHFSYTKITPGNLKVSNETGTRILEIDTVTNNNLSIKYTVPDDNSFIGIYKSDSARSYMKTSGMWSPVYNNLSLESTKKNITADDGCLQQILNADIMDYNFKFEDDGDKKHIGLIIPDDGGPYKIAEKALSHDRDSIDLYSAVMMTWKAIQELYAELKEKKGE